ncbi:hypothetical protein Tco_0759061 [Tanacetum coccineum]
MSHQTIKNHGIAKVELAPCGVGLSCESDRMKSLKLQFSSGSAEASGFESMFSIPSSTINLLKVGSSRQRLGEDISNLILSGNEITRLFEIAIALVLSQSMGTFLYMMS